MMASHGVDVTGTDYNEDLVATLNAGRTTFKEEGLDELFEAAVKAGVKFTTEYQKCDTYIVSVPTPYDKVDKRIDPSYVVTACETVLEVAPEGATLVIESTISPNTIDRFVRPLLEGVGRQDVSLVHAPERIIPGNMVYELVHNNRTMARTTRRWGAASRGSTPPSARRDLGHRHPHRRDDQGRGEHLPRRKHCLCKRTRQDLPHRRHGRGRGHPDR